jgi:hypothetical protein
MVVRTQTKAAQTISLFNVYSAYMSFVKQTQMLKCVWILQKARVFVQASVF